MEYPIKNNLFYLTLILSICIGCSSLFKDSGTNVLVRDIGSVEGVIRDVANDIILPGVVVQIGDKSIETNSNGVYTIEDLNTGSRTITASKTDYKLYSDTVTIEKGTMITKNIQLESDVSVDNYAPIANAGPDQQVVIDSIVNLFGANSIDQDGDILIYYWSFSSVPDGSTTTLSDKNIANPNFTADVIGVYKLILEVSDGEASSSDEVIIRALNTIGLVAYYPFNGNANDESGNGNNGSLVNNASITVNGKFDKGVILDGVDDNINLGTQVLNNPTAGSVSVWLKPTTNGSSGTGYPWLNTTVLSKGALYMALQITSANKIRIYYYDPVYQNIDSNTAIAVNSWNYVTYTWNGSGSQIYINGVLDKTSVLTWTDVSADHLNTQAKIGIEQWGNNYFYTGFIDEIQIYNRVLTNDEIKSFFQ